MNKRAPLLLTILTIIGPVYSCPIEGQDKDQLLSELCNIDDGNWASNRLNEMIILAKYERLPHKTKRKIIARLQHLHANLSISDKRLLISVVIFLF